MEFEFVEIKIFHLKCYASAIQRLICIWLCLSKCINGIISRISQRNLEILFAQGSHESLKRLEDKTREGPFFRVQNGKISAPKSQYFFLTLCKWKIIRNSKFKCSVISEKLSGNCNFLLICMQKPNWDMFATTINEYSIKQVISIYYKNS